MGRSWNEHTKYTLRRFKKKKTQYKWYKQCTRNKRIRQLAKLSPAEFERYVATSVLSTVGQGARRYQGCGKNTFLLRVKYKRGKKTFIVTIKTGRHNASGTAPHIQHVRHEDNNASEHLIVFVYLNPLPNSSCPNTGLDVHVITDEKLQRAGVAKDQYAGHDTATSYEDFKQHATQLSGQECLVDELKKYAHAALCDGDATE